MTTPAAPPAPPPPPGGGMRARFAPSPTGYLHLGGARAALFCRAWARKHDGEFLLRIEDTDAARSREEFVAPILSALKWLGLEWDGEPVFQSARRGLHLQAAERLLESGHAYRCYCGPEELAAMRAEQVARGENPRYDRRWRDATTPPPPGVAPAIRFKTPTDGAVQFHDLVKGPLQIDRAALDDFVVVRADGTPTYNLACVVDDAAMGITDVIRGDDHAMNTFKQILVHEALDGTPPSFAHLPMILGAARDADGKPALGPDGAPRYERMSKRNGAVNVNLYRRAGFLPEALLNYLARLSWSHGDDEFFSPDEFYRRFDLDAVQKSPARFDLEKLKWLNREHLRATAATPAGGGNGWERVRRAGRAMAPGEADAESFWNNIADSQLALTLPRAATLRELQWESEFFLHRPPELYALQLGRNGGAGDADGKNAGLPGPPEEMLLEMVQTAGLRADIRAPFAELRAALAALPEWRAAGIKKEIADTAKRAGLGFARLAMPLRALLTGYTESPDISRVAEELGRHETLERLRPADKI